MFSGEPCHIWSSWIVSGSHDNVVWFLQGSGYNMYSKLGKKCKNVYRHSRRRCIAFIFDQLGDISKILLCHLEKTYSFSSVLILFSIWWISACRFSGVLLTAISSQICSALPLSSCNCVWYIERLTDWLILQATGKETGQSYYMIYNEAKDEHASNINPAWETNPVCNRIACHIIIIITKKAVCNVYFLSD